jgi:DNA-binding Lrp family transcriptional regulator
MTQTELSERRSLEHGLCPAAESAGGGRVHYWLPSRALPEALGFSTTVLVRITLDSQNDEALHAFEAAVGKCTWITHCVLTSGSDDYLLTVIAPDVADFERIHKTQLSTLPRRTHSIMLRGPRSGQAQRRPDGDS